MKRNIPEEDHTPVHVPGLDVPAVMVEGAFIMIRGSMVRLAMNEGKQIRCVLAMQLIDAVSLAEGILASRDEMLRQAVEAGNEAPKSAIHRQN